MRARGAVRPRQRAIARTAHADDGPDHRHLRGPGRPWQGARGGRIRHHAGPVVLRLPFPRQPDHARLPRPRRAVAADRLQPRLARLAGAGLRAGRGRGEADRHGPPRPQDADLRYVDGEVHQGHVQTRGSPDHGAVRPTASKASKVRGRSLPGESCRNLPHLGQGHEGRHAGSSQKQRKLDAGRRLRSKTDLGFIGVPSAATTRISGRTGLLGMWSMAD
jgi:hypothetical protein